MWPWVSRWCACEHVCKKRFRAGHGLIATGQQLKQVRVRNNYRTDITPGCSASSAAFVHHIPPETHAKYAAQTAFNDHDQTLLPILHDTLFANPPSRVCCAVINVPWAPHKHAKKFETEPATSQTLTGATSVEHPLFHALLPPFSWQNVGR